jgi:hypothetical protein
VSSLELGVGYSHDMMRLRRATTIGTIAQNWTTTIISQQPDSFTARLTAPAGLFFDGRGTILNLEFQTFLGHTLECELPLTITLLDTGCRDILTRPGHVSLAICGLSYRIIEMAGSTSLDKNYPNPFNPATSIGFTLGLDGMAKLEIVDSRGRNVATLVDEFLQAGPYTVMWDATDQPSGLYYYRLTSGDWSEMKAMIVIQ